jgi:hypothetical protein
MCCGFMGITAEQCCDRHSVKCEKLPVPMPPSSVIVDMSGCTTSNDTISGYAC